MRNGIHDMQRDAELAATLVRDAILASGGEYEAEVEFGHTERVDIELGVRKVEPNRTLTFTLRIRGGVRIDRVGPT